MSLAVSIYDCDRLERIADVVQAELNTWLEGCGVMDKGAWVLSPESEPWLKVRCHKLALAVRDLRRFANKHRPEDYQI